MAQIENLTQALMGTTSNEGGIRQAGEQWLQRAEQSNLTGFLVALITELATEGRPPQARQAAGLKLKNIFESRNVETKQQLAQQWKQIPVEVKNQIKTQVLATLHSNVKDARKTTAQLLSTLANMELHQNSWGDVIQQLTMNVTQPKSEFGMESSLMALGYLCEECKAPALAQLMNPILSAVIHAMKQDKNTDIRLEATRALINSLVFIHKNFENEKERNIIMGAVCEATLSQDPRVRVASLECMSRISTLYYSGLSIEYIQAIFKITQTAKADKEEVAMQAIDIWTTIAEIEADILADIKFAEENGMDPPKKQCKNFIKTVYKPLIGILTELLVNQSENQADDDWNRSTAAATCLAFIAKVVGDAVVEATMPFISQNIQNQNWKFKEAATLAFSAILDGPTSKGEMKNLISKAVPIMLNHVTDKVSLVRDTTVFTLGRIALYHLDALIDQFLDNVVKALMFAMKDEESSVASKACWAVHNIAEGFDGGDEEPTNALSKHFKPLVEGLVYTTNREDVEENNLQLNTYEALRAVIQGCARDVYPLLDEIAKLIIQRLRDTLNKTPTSISEREEQNMIQSLLCGTLQAITNKMGSNIKKYANDLMQTYVAVMRSKPSGVHEDTLVAVGALATAIGKDFEPFMKVFEPHLHAGLKNKQEEIVCNFSVNTVGDLCVALEGKITPYADQIVSILLQNLQDPHINKNVKPGIISCFGDIALAVGGNFERYLKHVGLVLKQAAEAQVNASNDEMIEFMNRLRESIFEAYAGILQGLKKEKPQAFHPYVDQLAAFLKIVAVDPTVDDVVFKTAVSVIGDLANVYGSKAKQLLSQEFIAKMVQDAANSEDPETKDNAKWVQKQLKRIMTVA